MHSSLRRATVMMILLGVLFVPGLLQARTPARDWVRVSRPAVTESGFFGMVWNLLANFRGIGADMAPTGSSFAKNGGMMDPNGKPTPPPPPAEASTTGDNGGMMDPNG